MKHWRLVSLLLVVVLLTTMVASCKPKPKNKLEEIMDAGKIVVGTSADYPPFEFIDENNNFDGFDIALMNEIAKRMGVEVEWQDISFDGLIGALKAGKIDAIIAAMSATPERDQEVDFTIPYLEGSDAILVAEDSDIVIDSPEDMGQYKIGVQSGTIHEQWVDEHLPDAQVSRYERADQAIMDLKSGRIDVVAMDYYAAQAYIQQGGIKMALKANLSGESMAIAVPEGATELKAKLDEIITQLKDEGFIDDLAMKYLVEEN